MKIITLLAVSLAVTSVSFAKKTHSGRTEALTPEEQLKTFKLPEGYVIELVASEKDGLINPIDMAFDDAGRLWTQTAKMYPLDPGKDISWGQLLKLMANPELKKKNPELDKEFTRIQNLYEGKTKGEDSILVFSNLYGGGPVKTKVFADGLAIPQSILPYKSGAYVAQGSETFFLDDTNGDGVADKRTPILTGFGYTDTHTMSHTLVRGPGNWIHFSQGALNMGEVTAVKSGAKARFDYSKIGRFSIDGEKLELVSSGLNNIWGFWMRANGQWWGTEANDLGMSIMPMEPGTGFKGIGNQRLRPYQPWMPALHKFRVGGTGISGLAYSDDQSGGFPVEWKDVAFLANPITSKINAVRIVRNEDGSVTAKHLPDFLSCEDDWFRPVNMEFGPDGCLYIADWYNKIVSHNELPRTHPDRDKSHGRIWRIRYTGVKPRQVPDLSKAKPEELIASLSSPFSWEKRAAMQQITDRGLKQLTDSVKQLVNNKKAHPHNRIHALWALEGLGAYDEKTITALLSDEDGDIRRETVRSLQTFKLSPDETASLLKPLLNDKNVMVRSQIIRTLEFLGTANDKTIDILVSFCHAAAPNNKMGGGYEQNFERYLARRALERYRSELTAYLKSPLATKQPAEKRVWAQQALGQQASGSFAKQWQSLSKKPLDKDTLVIVSGQSADKNVQKLVQPYFANPKNAKHIAQIALKHAADAYTPAVGHPLAETAMTLVRSGNKEDIILGLQLARTYRITHLSAEFAKLIPAAKDETLNREIIASLSHLPKPYAKQFLAMVNDASNSKDLRIDALSALVQAQGDKSVPTVEKFLADHPTDKSTLINALGGTTQGNHVLLILVASKKLTTADIPLAIAERINHLYKNDPNAKAIHQQVTAQHKQQLNKDIARIAKLEKLFAQKPGNAATGQALFSGMCLSCHVVGDQGSGIGPALDGSAQRDTNHLLTAIINPDAAAENAYILYRTIESSGRITEGLKSKQNERGTSIAQQGGTITFIAKRTISQQHHVGSTSFMPTGLISSMPDSTVIDMLTYIRSLK